MMRSYDGGVGSGTIVINDPLLCSDAAAECRARSEFVKFGYPIVAATCKTYRTDLKVGHCVVIGEYKWKVINSSVSFQGGELINSIEVQRLEI